MELSIVLPAYKEAENLKKILPEIHAQVSKLNIEYEILIVDTIEKMDDTFDVCKSNNAVYITREGGNYYGDAIRTGIKKARGKYLVFMDADRSHEAKSIVDLYNEITNKNLDVVIGSRYCKGGKTDNNIILKMMSWSLNLTYRIIFRLKVKDCSNSFRIYKKEYLDKIELECDNFDIVEEILIKLVGNNSNLKIAEIPTYFKKRDQGVSKRDLVRFVFTYFQTIHKLRQLELGRGNHGVEK